MTKKEKALLQETIDELTAFIKERDLSREDLLNVECHIDALLWVQETMAK